ncbi:MAG TPA: hypothetical protein VFI65_15535 [Streptosporangiaceae bacterium]|nr:hypothetical protein [Streptosporangiaceae bacterium]
MSDSVSPAARRSFIPAAGVALTIAVSILQAGPASAASATSRPGGGQVAVPSISCPSARDCTAAGFLLPPGENFAFLASETGGSWRKAEKVPGTSALPGRNRRAVLNAVSCSAPGSCGAGGFYVDRARHTQAFVLSEKDGVWGKAKQVPGTAVLNVGGKASVDVMSCRSAGDCTAAGTYFAAAKNDKQAFVVSEKNGRWGTAEEIPGLASLTSSAADVNVLSCSSPGNCVVGGDYHVNAGEFNAAGSEPFVVSQRNGAWGLMQTFPAIKAVNTAGISSINGLSCRSAGTCLAAGTYRTFNGHDHVFSIAERDGTWGAFRPIPGMAALPGGGEFTATIANVSCPSAGDCAVGGTYSDGSLFGLPFLATQKNGTWGKARALPGVEGLGQGPVADLTAVSCPTAGNCTAVGDYTVNATTFSELAYVVSEKNGKWGQAQTLPGAKALSKHGELGPEALACGAPGDCAVGGIYFVANGLEAPFVATQQNGTWSKAERLPGT